MELVVFDCDGVLVDSEPLVAAVESSLLARHGITLSPAEILERFTGWREADVLAALSAEWGVALDGAFVAEKSDAVTDAFRTSLRPVAGMPEVLSRLRGPRCVASSSRPERIAMSLQLTGLAPCFGEHVYSAVSVRHGKPAPDLFLLAARSMGVDPAACTVVEDSVAGVSAGVAAGMRVIGFVAGGHHRPGGARLLAGAGASEVAHDAEELAVLLGVGRPS